MSKGSPFLAVLFLFIGLGLAAQDIQWNKCNTVEVMQWMRLQHPNMESDDAFEQWIAPKVTALSMDPRMRSSLTIPIVFHIIHDGTSIGSADNPAEGYIYAQIEQINNDFRKKVGTSGYNNHPDGADIELEFCPATQSPNGTILSNPGINRINRNELGWSAPPYGTCEGDNFGSSYIQNIIKPATQWDPNQYLNVWVLQTSCNVLGYAQFPSTSGLNGIGSSNGIAATDGVVIRPETLGSTDQNNPYSQNFGMGRTLTHELGHFFGLRHIWGDSNCGNDFCDDTPQSFSSNRGCPDITTCDGLKDMVENYMDYTNDACVNIFTQDQKSRMLTVLANSPRRGTLTSSTSCGANNAPLTSNFYASITQIDPGQSVQFTNLSSGNPISYQWTFSGGTPATSNLANPVVTYSNSGSFQVTLSITNATGEIHSVTKNNFITVRDKAVGSCPNATPIQNLMESFENTTYAWEQSTQDDMNWTRTTKATPSSGTGPQGASEGSHYLFMEASSPNYPNKTAILNSPCLHSLSITEGYLSFDYHLFSTDVSNTIGSLRLEYSTDQNTWSTLWEQNGSTGEDRWLTASINLESIVGQEQLYLRILGKTGTTWRNDIGIDHINFSQVAKSDIKTPKADFSSTTVSISTGETVAFTDESKNNPTYWEWTFEGGSPAYSANPNPVIIYNNPGTFDVQLIAGNEAGFDTLLMANYVTVSAPAINPIAQFTVATSTIEVASQITFEDRSIGTPNSWSWFFEGGTPQTSEDQNPIITYNSTGVFDVSLEVTNDNGSDTEIKYGYITVTDVQGAPIPDFVANKRVLAAGDSVVFDDISSGAVTSRAWTFTGGTPENSDKVEPVVVYNTPGFYNVKLKVSNGGESDSITKIDFIEVQENPLYPDLNCENGIHTFPYFEGFDITNKITWENNMSDDDFDWTYNSGNTPSSGTGPPSAANGTHYYFIEASNPNYPFKEAILESTCFDFSPYSDIQFTFQYHMNGIHTGTLSLEGKAGSGNWQTLWTKTGPQGNQWNKTVVDLSNFFGANPAVKFRLKASTTDGWQGDIAIDDIRIYTVDAQGQSPIAAFEADSLVVSKGSTVKFFDQSLHQPTSWLWTFEEGNPSSSSEQNPEITYDSAGTWDVFLKVSNTIGDDSLVKAGYILVNEDCGAELITLPYSESFETGWGAWQNIAEDSTYITNGIVDTLVDWQLIDTASLTPNTGPDSALHGQFYIYLESTDSIDNNLGELASLSSNCIDFGNADAPAIQFGYHFFGDSNDLDSLRLEGSNNGISWDTLWTITGNQTNNWDTAVVDLKTFAASGGTKLRFTANTKPGSGDLGDIAIDDIRIYDLVVPPVIASFPDSIFFTFGIDPWQQATDDDFDWTWTNEATPSSNTGPDSAFYGSHFIYAESSDPNYPNKTATLLSPAYDFSNVKAGGSPQLSFANHRFGGSVGSLEVFTSIDKVNWQLISKLEGEIVGSDWALETINLSTTASFILEKPLVWFKFVATTGTNWDGDIGLDYIKLSATPTIQDPIPDFVVSDTVIQVGQSVTFTDASTNNPNQWEWAIINQENDTLTKSTDSIFSFTFSKANDTLDVQLIAANEIGSDTVMKPKLIIVDSIYAPICDNPIDSLPYVFNFEGGNINPVFWNQSQTDDFDWLVKSGATPSLNTGPIKAKEGNFYAYLEASPPNSPNKTAILESNCLNWQAYQQIEMSFAYHLYGRDINSLSVQLRTDPNEQWFTFWEAKGNQGNQWLETTLNLSAYAGKNVVYLRIVGQTGGSWQGDIAIDQIAITGNSNQTLPVADFEATDTDIIAGESVQFYNLSQGATRIINWTFEGGTPQTSISQNPLIKYDTPGVYKVTLEVGNNYGSDVAVKNNFIVVASKGTVCGDASSTLTYSQGFENGVGDWIQDAEDDFDWEINSGLTNSSGTGPSAAFEGTYYAFIEASSPNYPNKSAILEGPCTDLSLLSIPYVRFSYHMYGSTVDMGKLELQAKSPSEEWSTIWSDSINRGNQWQVVNQSLSSLQSYEQTKLRFVATTKNSWQSDIAIDGIFILDSANLDAKLNIPGNPSLADNNADEFQDFRQKAEKKVDLYPNPASESIRVEYETFESGLADITIFDLLGNRQLKNNLQATRGQNTLDMDISRLPTGTYILAVQQNGEWTRKRFLKL